MQCLMTEVQCTRVAKIGVSLQYRRYPPVTHCRLQRVIGGYGNLNLRNLSLSEIERPANGEGKSMAGEQYRHSPLQSRFRGPWYRPTVNAVAAASVL